MSREQHDEARIQEAANTEMKTLFGVSPDAKPVDVSGINTDILYGPKPRSVEGVEIGKRTFGVEAYLPEGKTPPTTWVVAQHGYGGRARDYSKLAELLNKEGIGVLSLDMHMPQSATSGVSDAERMSMSVDAWAHAAAEVPKTILGRRQWKADHLIFIGQSSGGSGGAGMLVDGHAKHPYDGAILIGPTLITVSPDEFIQNMDAIVKKYAGEKGDVMLDWKWLAPLLEQMHDPELNRAYQAYLVNTPGFPLPAARECVAIAREKIIEQLSKIDVLTLMVKGEHDHVDEVSLKVAAEELAAHANPKVEIKLQVKGAGHQVHIERPDAIAALVKELLTKIKKKG